MGAAPRAGLEATAVLMAVVGRATGEKAMAVVTAVVAVGKVEAVAVAT